MAPSSNEYSFELERQLSDVPVRFYPGYSAHKTGRPRGGAVVPLDIKSLSVYRDFNGIGLPSTSR